jgi:hypothetical protein
MKLPQARRKCLNCKELFLPDYRNAQRQCYCLKPECRKARKRESQRAWLAKPENQKYFRDEKNAERVRNWQKEHPGYWKNTVRYQKYRGHISTFDIWFSTSARRLRSSRS